MYDKVRLYHTSNVMSIDLSKMPKLGFGLMRLPEINGEIDHE